MFKSPKKMETETTVQPHVPSQATTVIARGVKVEGDFNSDGDVLIEGEVKGSLKTTSDLSVGGESVIAADIKAGTATVSGRVDGNMIIDAQLVVKSSANIHGDIVAETMSVEKGAQLEGKVSIGGSSGTTQRTEVRTETSEEKDKDKA